MVGDGGQAVVSERLAQASRRMIAHDRPYPPARRLGVTPLGRCCVP
jgi:hypothetical protein